MNMRVDESWRDYQSARVEFLPGAVADLVGWGNLGDTAVVSYGAAGALVKQKTDRTAVREGDDVTLAVRLTNKKTGKPVAGAVIFKTRVDMAPDGMAEMQSQVAPLPSKEPGVYAFKTDMPMAGRYQVTLSAKVQGEAETVTGKVVVTATK